MSLFTPVAGVVGGSLIGGSAGALLLLNGDIMGISGIISNSIANPIESLRNPKHHWRWIFLASFSLTVNTYVNYLTPEIALEDTRSSNFADVPIPSIAAHLISGLLVGIGTKIQNGCTTGHGICGLGRLSRRSLAAVGTFTGASILTRYLIAPVRSWSTLTQFLRKDTLSTVSPLASEIITAALTLATMARPVFGTSAVDSAKSFGAALSGVMFAAGLAISGMTKNSKVHDFLCFSNVWVEKFDPTLVAVLGSGILASWLSYQFVSGYSAVSKDTALECPLSLPKGACFSVPTNMVIDSRLLIGAIIFGVGWGLSGICPGPGIYAAVSGAIDPAIAWMPGFLLGSFVGGKIVANLWDGNVKATKKL